MSAILLLNRLVCGGLGIYFLVQFWRKRAVPTPLVWLLLVLLFIDASR